MGNNYISIYTLLLPWLQIHCGSIQSGPQASYSWVTAESKLDRSPVHLDLGPRINIDPSGMVYKYMFDIFYSDLRLSFIDLCFQLFCVMYIYLM